MIDLSGEIGAYISATIVAGLGTLWFAFVLKGLRQLGSGPRFIVYGAIFAAYFILTLVLIDRMNAA